MWKYGKENVLLSVSSKLNEILKTKEASSSGWWFEGQLR